MSVYVYKSFEAGLWTVGYHDPQGQWEPDSDHRSEEAASARTHYINGGTTPHSDEVLQALDALTQVIGLTPLAGNREVVQKAVDAARAAIAKAKGGAA